MLNRDKLLTANLGPTTQISGTVGAATEAAKEGVPAIAFSGTTGTQISFTATTPSPNYPAVYAALSTTVTNALTRTAKPFLPPNVYLNVNFAAVTASNCTSPEDFRFVFTRIENATAQNTPGFPDMRLQPIAYRDRSGQEWRLFYFDFCRKRVHQK